MTGEEEARQGQAGKAVPRPRVLLVEDDVVDQLAFKRAVRELGSPCDYEVAGSVAEARELLSKNQYDAVVTDYALGDGTAFDVVELARGIPLVFTTGAGDEEVAVRAMKSGADDYLVKDHERAYLKKLPVTIENAIRRHRAEEQVRKLTRAVEQSPATVVITDTEGHIEYVNPKFTNLTGYSSDEVLGKNPRILKSGKHKKEEYKALWDTILAGKSWRGELQNKKKNGELYWERSVISSIINEKGEITNFVAVFEDITEQKRNLNELIALIDLSNLFITNDTGPMHIAYSLKKSTIALFGPCSPEQYGTMENTICLYKNVYCSPCVHEFIVPPCKGNNECMKQISVSEVMDSYKKILMGDYKSTNVFPVIYTVNDHALGRVQRKKQAE